MKSINPLFVIFILIWCDIGMTYIGMTKQMERYPIDWAKKELSFTVGPFIREFGLIPGLLIGGLINSTFIIGITNYTLKKYKSDFIYGGIVAIFIMALSINFRIAFML
jgi:hypothetical protein